MPKALLIFGTSVAALLLGTFGLNMVFGFPFKDVSFLANAAFVVCALILGYLSWSTMRDLK